MTAVHALIIGGEGYDGPEVRLYTTEAARDPALREDMQERFADEAADLGVDLGALDAGELERFWIERNEDGYETVVYLELLDVWGEG